MQIRDGSFSLLQYIGIAQHSGEKSKIVTLDECKLEMVVVAMGIDEQILSWTKEQFRQQLSSS